MNAFLQTARGAFLALLVAGTIAACDSTSSLESETTSEEELELFTAELSSELALSGSQLAGVNDAASRFGQNGPGEPGFLWRLAAQLSDSLTAEQKDRLLDPTRLRFRGLSGPRFGGGSGAVGRGILGDILTDDQKAAIEAIREGRRAEVEALLADFRAARDAGDDAAATAARDALGVIKEEVQAAVQAYLDANLTADQQAAIDAAQAEREAERAARLAAERAVMMEVLGISDAQADEIIAASEAFVEAARALDRNADFQDAVVALYTDLSATVAGVLNDDAAFEIWQIHEALSSRAGHRRGGRGRGGNRGRPAGGGTGG